MERVDYAKIINWNGTASRMINVNEIEDYQVGQIINPGMCWTDGGEFKVETTGDFAIIFKLIEDTEGHQVDYDNEEECDELGCEDCFGEKEIIIDKEFKISEIYEYDEEVGYMEILLVNI